MELPSRTFQPGAAPTDRSGDPERVEAICAVPPASSNSAGWPIRVEANPTKRRVRHDEHETAPGISLIGEVGGQ